MTTAIVAAMQEELASLLADMGSHAEKSCHGMRDFHRGVIQGVPCVAVLSRIGKVAAAATVATLVHEFDVERIIFTGVAGGISPEVNIGDVVVARELVQHDFDASPLFPRHEIPLLGKTRFGADPELSAIALEAAHHYLAHNDHERDHRAYLAENVPPSDTSVARKPRVWRGLIASGDEFVNHPDRVAALRAAFPDLLAVEMEGAAVAQVCHEFAIPFTVIRTISDAADHAARIDFARFIRQVASHYSHGIVQRMLAHAPAPKLNA